MLRYRTSLFCTRVDRRAATLASAGVLLSVGAASAGATDPFRDCDPIHDIGLARLADEAGDSVLAGALAQGGDSSRERALLAVRATPFAAAPEGLIPGLAKLACGRDPSLAPEAAAALAQIGERLRPSELAAREVLNADLRRALDALTAARSDARSLRPDIAHRLDSLVADLQALLGTKPE